MPRTKLPVSPHGGSPDETEAMFYEALQKGDVDLLMSCWAEDDEIVCVHPGGSRLMGAAAIRAAFEGMFAQGSIRVTISQIHMCSRCPVPCTTWPSGWKSCCLMGCTQRF